MSGITFVILSRVQLVGGTGAENLIQESFCFSPSLRKGFVNIKKMASELVIYFRQLDNKKFKQ